MLSVPKPNKSNFKIDEITLVLIVAFAALIVGVYNKSSSLSSQFHADPGLEEYSRLEAQKIIDMILNDNGFGSDGVIDEGELREIKEIEYGNFKDFLDAKNDFCVYIEGGNSNVIVAKGSSKLSFDNVQCKEQ